MIPYLKYIRILAISFWVSILLLAGFVIWRYHLDFNQMAFLLENFLKILRGNSYGYVLPLVFVVLFVARPLLLIPTIVMNIVAYTVFGPIEGLFLVLLAEQLSAGGLFLAVRYLAGDKVKDQILQVSKRMRLDINHEFKRQFAAVAVLRLASLPFDLVSSVCGASHIKLRPFLLASFLVSIPWVSIFFLSYGSLQSGSWVELAFNLAIFGLFIGAGWIIARRSKIIAPKEVELD